MSFDQEMNFLREYDIDENFYNNNYSGIGGDIDGEDFRESYYCSAKFRDHFGSGQATPNDLNIFHVNIRSLHKNGDELLAYLETLNLSFDVICITESWLLNDFSILAELFPHYNSYNSVRTGNHPSGGATVLVHKNFSSKEINELSCNSENLDAVFVEIHHKEKNYYGGFLI